MHDQAKTPEDDVPGAKPSDHDPAHTESGAPTNQAHRDVGDGTLVGSMPAGLSPKEMKEMQNADQSVEGGTS